MEDCGEYLGYEVGPIRPPSEAYSLLIRITRNCPWNKCRFCGVYKGRKFSIRPPEHVIKDIGAIKLCVESIESTNSSQNMQAAKDHIANLLGQGWERAYAAAVHWRRNGMESVFFQDANSMIVKTEDLVRILEALKISFPGIKRVTTYSRSDALARKSIEDLNKIRQAGLNRIHVGMESGSDRVLKLVKKGADKATHILAGTNVKAAGIELSEYYIPGLGGNELWAENALETADALNRINPDFIRIRSLAVTPKSELYEDYRRGVSTRANDIRMAEELLLMIENLSGISSTVVSDHIVNLLPEVGGTLPRDKRKMTDAIHWFLSLPDAESVIFRAGRRTNIMKNSADFYDEAKRARTERYMAEEGIDGTNIDEAADYLMSRFI